MNQIPVLGNSLRAARKKAYPDDTLEEFAVRIGVSRATLQRMEVGDLGVAIGRYFAAAKLLDLDEGFYALFKPVRRDNPFDKLSF